jgi:hypothetical protein
VFRKAELYHSEKKKSEEAAWFAVFGLVQDPKGKKCKTQQHKVPHLLLKHPEGF